MKTPTYGLIGRGRLALHLARYLELESRDVATWHRGSAAPPEAVLADAEVILLAISDGAIEPFIGTHPRLQGRPMVHFSGSLTTRTAHGLHPLMTFGPEVYDHAVYRSIPFIAERGSATFSEIFPGLDNPSRAIDPDLKPLYHALCVMAGNFTTLLWSKAMDDFEEKLGLPAEILHSYLRQTMTNTLEAGGTSLTGPLARGDLATIDRDLAGLDGDPFSGVYRAFARATGGLVVRS